MGGVNGAHLRAQFPSAMSDPVVPDVMVSNACRSASSGGPPQLKRCNGSTGDDFECIELNGVGSRCWALPECERREQLDVELFWVAALDAAHRHNGAALRATGAGLRTGWLTQHPAGLWPVRPRGMYYDFCVT